MFKRRPVHTPELANHQLDFKPIPEVSNEKIVEQCVLGRLAYAAGNGFGAYVVRDADPKIISSVVDELIGNFGTAVADFGKGRALHTHWGGSSFGTRMTIHETTKGVGEAIILNWSGYPAVHDATYGNIEPDEQAERRILFTEGLLRTFPNQLPELALKTTLEAGDMLVFDHTQPHAFMATTDNRSAQATYAI